MAKHALVDQPSAKPTLKVTAAGVGGLVATLVLTLADLADVVDLPTFGDTLVTFASAFGAAYLKKARAVEPGA